MDRFEDLVGGHVDVDDLDQVEDAEGSAQPRGEVQTDRRHRVTDPEVVLREVLAPDGARLCAHASDRTPARVGVVEDPTT